jgi:hypothetical protein
MTPRRTRWWPWIASARCRPCRPGPASASSTPAAAPACTWRPSWLLAAGIEANFEKDGVEYRLGAERHSVHDFVAAIAAAGFAPPRMEEHGIDASWAARLPNAGKYTGRPILLLLVAARRRAERPPASPA